MFNHYYVKGFWLKDLYNNLFLRGSSVRYFYSFQSSEFPKDIIQYDIYMEKLDFIKYL